MKVKDVVDLLISCGGYKLTKEPLHILDVNFVFDAILVGPDEQSGLVVVHEASKEDGGLIERKIKSLALALERTESTRTLLLLLTTEKDTPLLTSELEKICRTIILRGGAEPKEALRLLLPLKLPSPIESLGVADTSLLKEALTDESNPVVDRLLKAAKKGSKEVKETMENIIADIASEGAKT